MDNKKTYILPLMKVLHKAGIDLKSYCKKDKSLFYLYLQENNRTEDHFKAFKFLFSQGLDPLDNEIEDILSLLATTLDGDSMQRKLRNIRGSHSGEKSYSILLIKYTLEYLILSGKNSVLINALNNIKTNNIGCRFSIDNLFIPLNNESIDILNSLISPIYNDNKDLFIIDTLDKLSDFEIVFDSDDYDYRYILRSNADHSQEVEFDAWHMALLKRQTMSYKNQKFDAFLNLLEATMDNYRLENPNDKKFKQADEELREIKKSTQKVDSRFQFFYDVSINTLKELNKTEQEKTFNYSYQN